MDEYVYLQDMRGHVLVTDRDDPKAPELEFRLSDRGYVQQKITGSWVCVKKRNNVLMTCSDKKFLCEDVKKLHQTMMERKQRREGKNEILS